MPYSIWAVSKIGAARVDVWSKNERVKGKRERVCVSVCQVRSEERERSAEIVWTEVTPDDRRDGRARR